LFYAIKANPNDELLRIIYSENLGFECVSPREVEYILNMFPDIDKTRILFTPNFAPKEEYIQGFNFGVFVTLDNLYPLLTWPEVFRNKTIFVRVDTGKGHGHHKFVKTAGETSKFGVPISKMDILAEKAKENNVRVIGLHSHAGSGILKEFDNWSNTAQTLYNLKSILPDLRYIDLGGGLGVIQNPTIPNQTTLDISLVGNLLQQFKSEHNDIELWMEPGRYIIAESCVLLAKITQIKDKHTMKFVGVNTGFNSLIRPILYGSYHHIVNLSRLNEPRDWKVDVVGMICESGDVLGKNRRFPISVDGDIVLIAVAGAYGRSMSMHYNMRNPAQEIFID